MGENNKTKVFAKGMMPTIANPDDAGLDLRYHGNKEITFIEGVVYKVPTGVHVEIPVGKCGIIFERSGNGSKFGIQILGRIVDAPYRGEIFVICAKNFSSTCDLSLEDSLVVPMPKFTLSPTDKIAQMVIVDCFPQIEKVKTLEELTLTVRGAKGLGSSDEKKS